MQKPQMQDFGCTAVWTFGTAGILFAVGLTAEIPLTQLLTPTAIMLLLGLGLVVSTIDLVIVLRNPERLAIARGERMPSVKSVQEVQEGASRVVRLYRWTMMAGIGVALVVLVGFALLY